VHATVMAKNSDAEVPLGVRLWNLCDDRHYTPAPAALQSLIVKGADVNAKNKYSISVLSTAVMRGHLGAVKTLLAAEGIDIDAKDDFRMTALMYACYGGHLEITKALLEALKKTSSFDINDKCNSGMTALIWSCYYSGVDVTKLLLSIPRINPLLKDGGGMTAFDHVKGRASEGGVRALLLGELLPF
jgi:ankyrin repeat protein